MSKQLIQLYPTNNVLPRPREIAELYLLNRRHEGALSALWHAVRRQVLASRALWLRIDNLGLVVNTISADAGENS